MVNNEIFAGARDREITTQPVSKRSMHTFVPLASLHDQLHRMKGTKARD